MTPSKELAGVCEQEFKEHNPFEELLKIEGLPRKDPAPPEKRWRVVGLVYGFRWVELEFEEEKERKTSYRECECCGKRDGDMDSGCYGDRRIVTRIQIEKYTVVKREKVRQRVVTAVKIELS